MHIFLRTDRMILRWFTEADVDLLVELDSDSEVMCYITGGRPTPREEVERRPAGFPRLLRAVRGLRLLGGDRSGHRRLPGVVPLPAA